MITLSFLVNSGVTRLKASDIEVPFNELVKDPNFILIVIGAVIWFAAPYIPFIQPIFMTAGFVLTCLATAASALKRPLTMAWPGLIIGILIYLVGLYLAFIPILGNALSVIGAVLILFSAVPLALQYGNAPLMESFSDILEKKDKEKKAQTEEEPVTSKEKSEEIAQPDDMV
ncbi:MAG: hypothetical protein EAX81_00860 [Candidatus Thorarchaeota archaeon]|nr:hypothetical protein [Candidatus Thorarchaeota archaeon]